jgi:uncharacterized damage-inducible protein DinB
VTEQATTGQGQSGETEDYPRTMEEVHAYLDAARGRLLAVVEPRSDEEIARVGPEGWSVKDHLTHLAMWERSMHAVLTGGDKAAALGVPAEVYASPGYDDTNEIIRARWAGVSRAEAMAMLAEARAGTLAILAGMTYDDLMRPYAHYQPGSPEKTDPVAYWLAGNTWQHDDEHRPWVEGLLDGAGS